MRTPAYKRSAVAACVRQGQVHFTTSAHHDCRPPHRKTASAEWGRPQLRRRIASAAVAAGPRVPARPRQSARTREPRPARGLPLQGGKVNASADTRRAMPCGTVGTAALLEAISGGAARPSTRSETVPKERVRASVWTEVSALGLRRFRTPVPPPIPVGGAKPGHANGVLPLKSGAKRRASGGERTRTWSGRTDSTRRP